MCGTTGIIDDDGWLLFGVVYLSIFMMVLAFTMAAELTSILLLLIMLRMGRVMTAVGKGQ